MDANYYHEKLEQLLGYSFNEKDLSPSTRRMISEYKNYAEEMHKIEQTFKGKIPKEQEVDKVYSFFRIRHLLSLFVGEIILGILIFAAIIIFYMMIEEGYAYSYYSMLVYEIIIFGMMLLMILYPVMDYYNLSKSRNTAHKYYELKNKFSPLIEAIHKDLSEVYRLKLRPEIVEYKIVADFSFKEGVLSIKCPNCGANIDILKDKIEGNKYKCPYCQTTIILPKKLLDLI